MRQGIENILEYYEKTKEEIYRDSTAYLQLKVKIKII